MMIKRLFLGAILLLSMTAATTAAADEPGRYGSLWLGPRLGPAFGISGPRGGYMIGLELSYRTPFYFYYNFEVSFFHLLSRTITIPATTQETFEGSGTFDVVAPEHEAKVTGLYGVPITLEIGLRFAVRRARLRAGVGFGAMISAQTLESYGNDESEVIASFCFRPAFGVDIVNRDGDGLIMLDLMYLWQDADFEITGSDRDVNSVLLTIGYSWQLRE